MNHYADTFYFKLQNVTVGYHHQPLIKDINFSLEKGEILTLIGPNGAGKSTILKSMIRQLKLLNGDIKIADASIFSMSKQRLAESMAIVLTNRISDGEMTCQEIIETGRYPYTGTLGILTASDRKIVEEAMQMVAVSEYRNRSFQSLSDGQKQRVLLARAIAQDADILIMDEPTSYLDIRYKLEFLEIIKKLSREKKITVIMSLHELDMARQISDKVLCVKGETIHQIGKPSEVLTNAYLAKLFDVPERFINPENGEFYLR